MGMNSVIPCTMPSIMKNSHMMVSIVWLGILCKPSYIVGCARCLCCPVCYKLVERR
jgi:hypothetical protein